MSGGSPVQSPAGHGARQRPDKSRPLGAEYLAKPSDGLAPFLRDRSLLPKRPPTRDGRPYSPEAP